MDVQVPVDTGTDTDAGTDTGAVSSGAGRKKGFTPSHVDASCDSCGVCVWREDKSTGLNRELSRHINAKNGRCRPDGTLKPATEAKTLTEHVITNRNLFEVRGPKECSFLRRNDADDSHECSSCTKLFATFDQADHHCNYAKCKDVRPPKLSGQICTLFAVTANLCMHTSFAATANLCRLVPPLVHATVDPALCRTRAQRGERKTAAITSHHFSNATPTQPPPASNHATGLRATQRYS